jgi:hypothetical protein
MLGAAMVSATATASSALFCAPITGVDPGAAPPLAPADNSRVLVARCTAPQTLLLMLSSFVGVAAGSGSGIAKGDDDATSSAAAFCFGSASSSSAEGRSIAVSSALCTRLLRASSSCGAPPAGLDALDRLRPRDSDVSSRSSAAAAEAALCCRMLARNSCLAAMNVAPGPHDSDDHRGVSLCVMTLPDTAGSISVRTCRTRATGTALPVET